jgi:hypothetical protein
MIDLQALDLSTSEGYEFEYVSESSAIPSGIYITVLGSNSDHVKKWVRQALNKMRQREAMQAKRGKDVDIRTVEDDEQFSIESAAIRVTGWRGISQEFTPELAIKLCTINPEIRAQIIKESDDLGNFTKSKSAN